MDGKAAWGEAVKEWNRSNGWTGKKGGAKWEQIGKQHPSYDEVLKIKARLEAGESAPATPPAAAAPEPVVEERPIVAAPTITPTIDVSKPKVEAQEVDAGPVQDDYYGLIAVPYKNLPELLRRDHEAKKAAGKATFRVDADGMVSTQEIRPVLEQLVRNINLNLISTPEVENLEDRAKRLVQRREAARMERISSEKRRVEEAKRKEDEDARRMVEEQQARFKAMMSKPPPTAVPDDDAEELKFFTFKGKRLLISDQKEVFTVGPKGDLGKFVGIYSEKDNLIKRAPIPQFEDSGTLDEVSNSELAEINGVSIDVPEEDDESDLMEFRLNGIDYYRTNKNEVWLRGPRGSLGAWQGIYDPFKARIVPAPEPEFD